MATSYVYTNQATGQKVEQTEFHNVVLWRKLGEIANQYLKKGNQLYIEGRLQTRKWEKDGVTRYSTEIVADQMQMLGTGREGGSTAFDGGDMDQGGGMDDYNQAPPRQQPAMGGGNTGANRNAFQPAASKPAGNFDDFDDDIPF